jgi:hypothetical protein
MKREIETLAEKCVEIIKENNFVNVGGGIEIYTDYRDRVLSTETLKKIFNANHPREYFGDMLSDWSSDYACNYGYDELESEIKKELTEEEKELYAEYNSDIWEYIQQEIYFYYNSEDFNNDIDVNIMLDVGNGKTDYTCDSVLNWDGDGSFDERSSILWLAKQQGKAAELQNACKAVHRDDGNYLDRKVQKDKFIESCVQELENLSSYMGTLTFLVKMSLFQLFDLLEIQKAEYISEAKYDPRKNPSKSYLTLGKSTMCGLYNPWSGAGSVLEIELDKDVDIPIKFCEFCVDGCKMRGYDVNEVYGLTGNCWKETLKDVTK